jgi:hypothetical protein
VVSCIWPQPLPDGPSLQSWHGIWLGRWRWQPSPRYSIVPVDEAQIRDEAPDAVILATGANPLSPPIPGSDLPHVVQAWDVLAEQAVTGQQVAIIGGGAVGVETALVSGGEGTLSAEGVKFLLVNRAEDPETLFEMATRGTRQVTLWRCWTRWAKTLASPRAGE